MKKKPKMTPEMLAYFREMGRQGGQRAHKLIPKDDWSRWGKKGAKASKKVGRRKK